jgi:hypothetical protein
MKALSLEYSITDEASRNAAFLRSYLTAGRNILRVVNKWDTQEVSSGPHSYRLPDRHDVLNHMDLVLDD